MKLHEAIQAILSKNRRPMKVKDIVLEINSDGYYYRGDGEPVTNSQIYLRIKNYPSLFQNINGIIFLVYDYHWKNILINYEYLTNSLQGIFIQQDVQFTVSVLLYYKRLFDINQRYNRRYPIFDNQSNNFSQYDSVESFLHEIKLLENLNFAPTGAFEELNRLLAKLSHSKIQEVLSVLKQIETANFNDEEFGNIYEYLLTLVSLGNNKTSLNHTPYSLRQLMVEVLNPNEGASIYDPTAGMGGLLIETLLLSNKNVHVSGSEINERIALLGNMTAVMYGFNNIEIITEDCFKNLNSNKLYDYIISDLPANGITTSLEHKMLYDRYNLTPPKSGKSFSSLVLFILSKLNDNGKAVLTVSDGFLVKRGKEQSIRALLIERDIIETIISLPSGVLRPYTDAKASLLVLNNNKPQHLKNKIQFIKSEIYDQTTKSIILDNDEILTSYFNSESFNKNKFIIDVEDLKDDVNLLGESYDEQFLLSIDMLKDNRAKLLGDLVNIKSGINPKKPDIHSDSTIPLVRVEKLSKDILDLNLNLKNSDGINNEFHYQRNIIYVECILVARVGESLKATIFRPSNAFPGILPHNNVYVLIPKRPDMNIEYLYYQLHSTFIKEQIERRKLGTVMPYISISGLKEIVIPFMSLESQQEFVQSQKANLIIEERNKVEEKILALGYQEETKQAEADIIKILTHQLRPTFTGLKGITNRIDRIVKTNNLGHLEEYSNIELNIDPEIEDQIVIPDNHTLRQLLEKLSNETNHLSEILSNVDKVMNFKILQEDLQEIEFLEFLRNYKLQKEVGQNQMFKIDIKGEPAKVFIHKPSFKELLDTLLINAEKHAFESNNKANSNKVAFSVRVSKKRQVVSVEYSNNGKPFELTHKDFITAFEKGNKSKGSGIGGNYINRIVLGHNGTLKVTENNKKGFSLTIELPTSKSKIYE